MCALFALSPVRAETREVELAERSAGVGFRANGAEGAEAPVVVWTGAEFGCGVDVEVEAFVAVGAVEGAGVLVAFGHAASMERGMSVKWMRSRSRRR